MHDGHWRIAWKPVHLHCRHPYGDCWLGGMRTPPLLACHHLWALNWAPAACAGDRLQDGLYSGAEKLRR